MRRWRCAAKGCDAIHDALQNWSRATISRDLDGLYQRGLIFEPEFEGASRRFKWIAMDLSGRHRFYVADEKAKASADPVGELRELRRRRRAQADRRQRGCRAAKPQVATLYGPGPIIRHRCAARPRWLAARPTWLAT